MMDFQNYSFSSLGSGRFLVSDIPGDKSISHRSVIVGALCENMSEFMGFLCSEDCLHTLEIMRQLGVDISREGQRVVVKGVGLWGLVGSSNVLDVGNSGTAIRLLLGVLAAQKFDSRITGDSSIQSRPMRRVVDPLREMGADIQGELAPLEIVGGKSLLGISYEMPMASAQVKSAVLLAGLFAKGETLVNSPGVCRDHTERLLAFFGADILFDSTSAILKPGASLSNPSDEAIQIPSDLSSAAFFIVLALLGDGLDVTFEHVGINPTRDAILGLLKDMGGDIRVCSSGVSFDPMGDVRVLSSACTNLLVPADRIGNLIDEFPILAVLAMFSEGDFVVRGAGELRKKESDRISGIVRLIEAFGGDIEEFDDGFVIHGGGAGLRKAAFGKSVRFDAEFDHRLVMSAVVAAAVSGAKLSVAGVESVKTSFPSFFEILERFCEKESIG